MPLKNFETVGVLQGYEYLRGVITSINHVTDTCGLTAKVMRSDGNTISFAEQGYSDVPVFYHCNPDAVELASGAIKGGSWAFAVGDEVTVLRQRAGCPGDEGKIFITGFVCGARKCAPVVIIYSTQSGQEAIAWDVLNDCALPEFGNNLTAVQTALHAAGVTEQDECVIDETRWACLLMGYNESKIEGCPATGMGLANDFVNEPFHSGSYVSRLTGTSISGPGYMDSGGECPAPGSPYWGTGYGAPYLFFTNPHPRADQTPADAIPGPWTGYLFGHLYEKRYVNGIEYPGGWDVTNWGACPYPYNQLYYVNPDTGRTINRWSIPITYLYFRSLLDYEFDYGGARPISRAFSTVLTVPALNLCATEMLISTRDATLRLFSSINEATWLSANLSQVSYNEMESMDTQYMNPVASSGQVAMHPYFPMPYMIDKADGLATHGEISVFFESCGVYPDAYTWYEEGEVWDETKLADYRQVFRVHFHHPYPLKNMDAILFKRVNDLREDAGKKTLKWNWNLQRAAQRMADDMAARKNIEPAHIGSDGSTIEERSEDAGFVLFYNPYPASIGGSALLPFRRYCGGENNVTSPIGFTWQLKGVVDNTLLDNLPVDSHATGGIPVQTDGLGWKQSPGHYDNILFDDFRETGIATAMGSDGFTYITQVFGGRGDDIVWNGFSSLPQENVLAYVNSNFTFDKHADDTRRKPRVLLCTIPQD